MSSDKEKIMRVLLSIAHDVSKDTESAREYLASEGIVVNLPETPYAEWRKQLIDVAKEKTGNADFRINDAEAFRWWKDGFTPYQTFRETYSNENDSE